MRGQLSVVVAMAELAATDAGMAPKKRSPKEKFAIPDGWVARGFTFEVEWPDDPEAASKVRSHFGARRFAYNWALDRVKADMQAEKSDPSHQSVPWNLYALQKRFNADKPAIAPWWREGSKEAYSTGIADLCTALKSFSESKSGKHKGRAVGFPRFKSRRKDQARLRFRTGAMRVTPDRRTITLPVVGPLCSKESTRRLERLVTVGRARILSATLSERWGRLFASFSCLSKPIPVNPRPGAAGLGWTSTCGCSPPSPTTRAPSPKSETPPPSGPRSKSAAGWDDSSLDASPAHVATGRRKPSSPGRTEESCTCDEKEHGAPGLPASCLRRCAGCDQAPAHLQDGMETNHPHGRRPVVRILEDPSRVRLSPGRPGHQRSA